MRAVCVCVCVCVCVTFGVSFLPFSLVLRLGVRRTWTSRLIGVLPFTVNPL